jgi:iron complex outermembrane recepter protein
LLALLAAMELASMTSRAQGTGPTNQAPGATSSQSIATLAQETTLGQSSGNAPQVSAVAQSSGTPEQAPAGSPSNTAQGQTTAPSSGNTLAGQPPSGGELPEVTVTGTRIHGVQQVGSASINLSQVELQASGLSSTADVLQQYPQLLSLGSGIGATGAGTDQQGETLDTTFATAVNIRGIGREATLSLLDGHRVPYTSTDISFWDPNSIPLQMLQRVEVVPDGTSPIYGADAVAGTVNYILRKPFTGAESYFQYGVAQGENQWQATQIVGLTWGGDASGFVIGYQHTHQGALNAVDRSFYSDDFAPFGGPTSSDLAAPGNVVVGFTPYAIPRMQNGTALTLAELGPPGSENTQNAWYDQQALPETIRNSVTFDANEKLSDAINLFADGYYTKRDYSILQEPVGEALFVPDTNAYTPCNRPAGAPAALIGACASLGPYGPFFGPGLTVDYSFANQIANERYGDQETYNVFGGVQFTLPYRWELTLEGGHGHDIDLANNPNSSISDLPGTPLADELASSNPATAFNPFCDATSFKTCNPESLLTALLGSGFLDVTYYGMSDYDLNADGPLFSLPGGDVRLAVGAEDNRQVVQANNTFGPGNVLHRRIDSGYVELYVPLVGSGNALPGVQKLVLDLAGRIDSFDDQIVNLGSKRNPKIGLEWTPVDGFKVHGSFGTSFRPPSMLEEDITAQHGYIGLPSFDAVSIPCNGCNFPGALLPIDVGYHTTEASTARSFSFGFDWVPTQWEGFDLSINWYKLTYYNDVDTPLSDLGYVAALNSQQYNSLYIYNPTYFPALAANNPVAFVLPGATNASRCSAVIGKKITTQALFNAYIGCLDAGGDAGFLGPPVLASQVIAIADAEHINSTTIDTNGLDIAVNQAWPTRYGTFHAGAVAENAFNYYVSLLPGAPGVNEISELSFPIRLKARAQLGWQVDIGQDSLTATAFLNYTAPYHVPLADLPVGVPYQYSNVASYSTLDLAVIYDMHQYMPKLVRNGVTLMFSVQNLMNKPPPLVINFASTGAGTLYDPSNASPLQRVFQLQAAVKF